MLLTTTKKREVGIGEGATGATGGVVTVARAGGAHVVSTK